MKTHAKSFLFAMALAVAFALNAVGAPAEIGKAAPDFTLTDITGTTRRLSDYKGKVVVLEWINSGCPIVQKHYHSRNMQNTQKSAVADGVVWLSINSAGDKGAQGNLGDSEAAAWLKKMGSGATAYLRDQTGKVGRLYGARVTPHMYIIDREGTLVYQGAIDSISSAREEDIPRATNYVKAALGALKAGQPIEKAVTTPYGCAVKYGSKNDA